MNQQEATLDTSFRDSITRASERIKKIETMERQLARKKMAKKRRGKLQDQLQVVQLMYAEDRITIFLAIAQMDPEQVPDAIGGLELALHQVMMNPMGSLLEQIS